MWWDILKRTDGTIRSTDVSEDDWYYEAIEFVVTNGLFNGTSDTTFSPDKAMTRAMLVTVLYRLEGEPAVTGGDSFTDVKSGQWYTNAVLWASSNSIVAGYGDGRFGVNDTITREQMAAIMYRYAKYKDYSVSGLANLAGFTDLDKISDWASRAMKWAVAEELIAGVTATALEPFRAAPRGPKWQPFSCVLSKISQSKTKRRNRERYSSRCCRLRGEKQRRINMRKKAAKILSVCIVIVLLVSAAPPALAVSATELNASVSGTAAYVLDVVDNPQVGSVGGEWAVIGLVRSGYNVPETYYQKYYATVENYVKACNGELHRKKYTEYSRVILALTAIGKDPSDVAGYNLLTPLGDYDKTIYQGLNGPIWALISLDSGGYDMPQNPGAAVQATRDMYIDRILDCQLSDGGFSLFGGTAEATAADSAADPDITGMALQALAKYQDRTDVAEVIDEALARLSEMQDADGGYSSWGTANSESVVQVVVALTELGVSLDDSRFVKNGHTLLDNLLSYRQENGSFLHTSSGGGSNQMATEQGLYGLVAAQRASKGQNSLYRMGDALSVADSDGKRADAGQRSGRQKSRCAVRTHNSARHDV